MGFTHSVLFILGSNCCCSPVQVYVEVKFKLIRLLIFLPILTLQLLPTSPQHVYMLWLSKPYVVRRLSIKGVKSQFSIQPCIITCSKMQKIDPNQCNKVQSLHLCREQIFFRGVCISVLTN